MSTNFPSQNEQLLSRCRALYLGTSLFTTNNKFDESKLTLDLLQKNISERYPIDGSQFSRGIETWLSIFQNGIQMEHSAASDSPSINALFYYPIKSLVYCGALRFIRLNKLEWKFVPLDTEVAQNKEHSKNPSLFVVLLKGIDSVTKSEIIETNVFVVGTKDISLGMVESCQQAYNKSKISRNDFYKKYGNIPVVFCLKENIHRKKDKRIVVKQFDVNGYFYATENTEIDLWQLFEEINGDFDRKITNFTEKIVPAQVPVQILTQVPTQVSEPLTDDDYTNTRILNQESNEPQYIDPYEKTENLIGVDKRVDPQTGQNIYVRYLTETTNADLNHKLNNEELERINKLADEAGIPAVLIREEKTPSPIVYERYIKKKAPQVIIKEIHVQDEAPVPIKYVQKSLDKYHNVIETNESVIDNKNKKNKDDQKSDGSGKVDKNEKKDKTRRKDSDDKNEKKEKSERRKNSDYDEKTERKNERRDRDHDEKIDRKSERRDKDYDEKTEKSERKTERRDRDKEKDRDRSKMDDLKNDRKSERKDKKYEDKYEKQDEKEKERDRDRERRDIDRRDHRLSHEESRPVYTPPIYTYYPDSNARLPTKSSLRRRDKSDYVGGDDVTDYDRKPQRNQEPVYFGVEQIPIQKTITDDISRPPIDSPLQNEGNDQGPGPITYREYNPYAAYYNNNGKPDIRKKTNSYQNLESNYNRNQQQNYRPSPNNLYSNPNLYSGHGTFYNLHNNHNHKSGHHHHSSHYSSHQKHSQRDSRNYNENNRSVSHKNYSNNYNENNNQRHYDTFPEKDKYSRGEDDHNKKKIYLVNESELDQLKNKLRQNNRNKKIVVIDESDVETLKEKLFGHNNDRSYKEARR